MSVLSLIMICQILCYSTNYFSWSDWSSSFWNIICKLHLLQSILSTRQFNGLSVAWEISKWVRRSRNQKMLASSEEKSWMVGDYHPPKGVNPGLNWLPGFVPSLPRLWNSFAHAKITIDNTFDPKRMYFMDGFSELDKIKILWKATAFRTPFNLTVNKCSHVACEFHGTQKSCSLVQKCILVWY